MKERTTCTFRDGTFEALFECKHTERSRCWRVAGRGRDIGIGNGGDGKRLLGDDNRGVGRRRGEADGVIEHVVPLLELVPEGKLFLDGTEKSMSWAI